MFKGMWTSLKMKGTLQREASVEGRRELDIMLGLNVSLLLCFLSPPSSFRKEMLTTSMISLWTKAFYVCLLCFVWSFMQKESATAGV